MSIYDARFEQYLKRNMSREESNAAADCACFFVDWVKRVDGGTFPVYDVVKIEAV